MLPLPAPSNLHISQDKSLWSLIMSWSTALTRFAGLISSCTRLELGAGGASRANRKLASRSGIAESTPRDTTPRTPTAPARLQWCPDVPCADKVMVSRTQEGNWESRQQQQPCWPDQPTRHHSALAADKVSQSRSRKSKGLETRAGG